MICEGKDSCHNAHLISSSDRIDGIELICEGENSCKHIRFQTFDTDLSLEQNLKLYMPYYLRTLNDDDEEEEGEEGEGENKGNENENDESTSGQNSSDENIATCSIDTPEHCETIADMKVDLKNNDAVLEYMKSLELELIDLTLNETTTTTTSETTAAGIENSENSANSENGQLRLEYGKHYMLARNCLSDELIEAIRSVGSFHAELEQFGEHREFGDAEESPYHGHTVVYLNHLLSQSNYTWFKKRLIEMFDNWQHSIVSNHSNDDESIIREKLTGFRDIDMLKKYNLKHDWEYFRDRVLRYNARVIEFIDYSIQGSLGWHTDDESDLTMVVLLNRPNIDFEGGLLQFKLQTIDKNIESVSLGTGDLILFPALTDHRVLPVINGSRQVLVIEWWDLPRNQLIGRHEPDQFVRLYNEHEAFEEFGNEWPVVEINARYQFNNISKFGPKEIHMPGYGYDEHKENKENTKKTENENENQKRDYEETLSNAVTFGDHFIHFSNILSTNMRHEISEMREKCLIKNENRDEHRSFGDDAYSNAGHVVTFMNDCFDKIEIYDYFKNIIVSGLDTLQQKCLVDSWCESPQYVNAKFEGIWKGGRMVDFEPCFYIENPENIPLLRHYGWKHDWYSLFEQCRRMDSRVIEYIIYNTNGTLGWHTDDESIITMVALLNDDNEETEETEGDAEQDKNNIENSDENSENGEDNRNTGSFEGGELEFRSHSNDEDIEQIRLKAGDIIIFPSMADHRVLPVWKGKRNVLVIEWWENIRNNFDGRITPHAFDIKLQCMNNGDSFDYCNEADVQDLIKQFEKHETDGSGYAGTYQGLPRGRRRPVRGFGVPKSDANSQGEGEGEGEKEKPPGRVDPETLELLKQRAAERKRQREQEKMQNEPNE